MRSAQTTFLGGPPWFFVVYVWNPFPGYSSFSK